MLNKNVGMVPKMSESESGLQRTSTSHDDYRVGEMEQRAELDQVTKRDGRWWNGDTVKLTPSPSKVPRSWVQSLLRK